MRELTSAVFQYQVFSLHLERFLHFSFRGNILTLDMLLVKDVFEFMSSLEYYEKPTDNHTMRAVRYYLKYCHENIFMEKEMFSRLPNPHYNWKSRLLSSYSANGATGQGKRNAVLFSLLYDTAGRV